VSRVARGTYSRCGFEVVSAEFFEEVVLVLVEVSVIV